MVQTVNNCCCFTLPVGAQILGWWGIIGGVFNFFGRVVVEGLNETFIGILVVSLVVIVVNALLIVGTREKSHNKILPWLILQTIGLVCMIIIIIIGVLALLLLDGGILSSVAEGSSQSQEVVIMFAIALFAAAFAGLQYYLIIAMYSHYKNIRDESRRSINRADAERLNPAP